MGKGATPFGRQTCTPTRVASYAQRLLFSLSLGEANAEVEGCGVAQHYCAFINNLCVANII